MTRGGSDNGRNHLSEYVLLTERLKLSLRSREDTLAQIEKMTPEERVEVSPVWLAQVRATTTADPWMLWWSINDRADGSEIGSCGFKGQPSADGMVEVAYGVNPDRERQGYATEACRALVKFALDSDLVRIVRAHTRKENAASGRVLEKCGFACLGEVIDPEDGLVLRWEMSRPRIS